MAEALRLAAFAATIGEVPVGAVVVKDGEIIGRGYNRREIEGQATRHAEIVAMEEASETLGAWRLSGCTLYVTLEPCLMCAGAIYQARVDEVHFGAWDAKAGACGSLYKIHEDSRLNHRFLVHPGVLESDSREMLQQFFRRRRQRRDGRVVEGARLEI
ncbi:MAG: hypothetical protein RIQ81_968 [Pseudomonadota bacterium]